MEKSRKITKLNRERNKNNNKNRTKANKPCFRSKRFFFWSLFSLTFSAVIFLFHHVFAGEQKKNSTRAYAIVDREFEKRQRYTTIREKSKVITFSIALRTCTQFLLLFDTVSFRSMVTLGFQCVLVVLLHCSISCLNLEFCASVLAVELRE